MGKKKTKDEFLYDLEQKFPKRFTLLGEYINSYTKTTFRCNICKDEFDAEPRLLLYRGSCGVCAGKKVLFGYNDLETLYPDIAKCWIKCINNESLTPRDVTYGSKKRVLWKCPFCGELYESDIMTRVQSLGCKKCGDVRGSKIRTRQILMENGSLLDNYPGLAEEWMYCIDNKNKLINETTCRSNTLIKWRCSECGHEWNALVSDRVDGHGCPKCARKEANIRRIQKVVQDNGSLNEVYPELAKELLYFIDNPLDTVDAVTPKCHKNAMWRCSICGYEWTTSVLNRANGSECPECVRSRSASNLQIKVSNYIEEHYGLNINHERGCILACTNPLTGMRLLYDNEIIFENGNKLIIEVNGEQHYKITGLTLLSSKNSERTPQEELEYLQYRDRIKKDFAICNGYNYLEIPYWTEKDESYKQIIDEKMQTLLKKEIDT